MTEKLNLFDVGARGGVGKRWQPFFDKLAVIGFDADQEECYKLNETQFPYDVNFQPYALGVLDGENATLLSLQTLRFFKTAETES